MWKRYDCCTQTGSYTQRFGYAISRNNNDPDELMISVRELECFAALDWGQCVTVVPQGEPVEYHEACLSSDNFWWDSDGPVIGHVVPMLPARFYGRRPAERVL